jgi:5,5'-dehydrodivanillate O-demethylase
MLTHEENERLTRVGPGTPMGDLLRRYWMPIAISSDISTRPVARRLLGENLVVFRTEAGQVGVVEERCAHRRTSLKVGIVEKAGIRCGYHGWMYDLKGQCIEQPAEPRLNSKVQITAYPAQEMGGLVFTYMGPQPAPLLPRFDLFVKENGIRDIGHAMLDLNWLQAMENSVDPHHVEWLHGAFMNANRSIEGEDPLDFTTKKHKKIGFDPFKYGIIKRRLLEGGSEEDDDWKVGHPLIFPNMLKVGGAGLSQFQIRVPIDDEHTWHIWYSHYQPKDMKLERQATIPSYIVPLKDERGEWILDFIDGQDISVWSEQGVIADRTKETLGASDMGIALYRKMLKEQLNTIAAGKTPLGQVWDEVENQCIVLPLEEDKHGTGMAFVRGMLQSQAIRYSPINRAVLDLFNKSASSSDAGTATELGSIADMKQ